MILEKSVNGDRASAAPEGRIDAKTAPQIEEELLSLPAEVKHLVVDFGRVRYISSAGLRMLAVVQQEFEDRNGSLRIVGAMREIMDIFELTGFTELLDIGE